MAALLTTAGRPRQFVRYSENGGRKIEHEDDEDELGCVTVIATPCTKAKPAACPPGCGLCRIVQEIWPPLVASQTSADGQGETQWP